MKRILSLVIFLALFGFANIPAAYAATCSSGYVQDLNSNYYQSDGVTPCTPPSGGSAALTSDPAPDMSCPPGQVQGLGSNAGKCFDSNQQQTSASPAPTKTVTSAPSSGSGINQSYLRGYADSIIGIINLVLLPVIVALSFIVFIWGVFKTYILSHGDSKAVSEGHQLIFWGIIGFVAIFSIWGLVNIVGATLGLAPGGSAQDHGLTTPTL